jgi:hypothetical protein
MPPFPVCGRAPTCPASLRDRRAVARPTNAAHPRLQSRVPSCLRATGGPSMRLCRSRLSWLWPRTQAPHVLTRLTGRRSASEHRPTRLRPWVPVRLSAASRPSVRPVAVHPMATSGQSPFCTLSSKAPRFFFLASQCYWFPQVFSRH